MQKRLPALVLLGLASPLAFGASPGPLASGPEAGTVPPSAPVSAIPSDSVVAQETGSAEGQRWKPPHSPALDRVNLSIGGFSGHTSTDLSGRTRGLPYNPSGKVNLEDDLGLKKRQNVGRVKLEVLLGDHQGFDFDYYQLNRSHGRNFSESMEAGGQSATVNARVSGNMDLDIGTATYRYWFGRDNDIFGFGLGAAYYRVNLEVRGSGSITSTLLDAPVAASGSASYREGAWAPVLSLGWRHAFNDQWRVYADASGIKKNGGNLAGHIYTGALGVEYYPWKNVGFGLDYSVSKLELRRNADSYGASLDLKTYGPGAYLHVRF